MSTYIVSFSGGLSSFEAARRTIEKHGHARTVLVFADVKGDPERDPHASREGHDGEHPDVYRFIEDAQRLLGQEVVRVRHPEGLSVWGMVFKKRAIRLPGQGGFAACTYYLKGEILDAFAADHADAIRVTGLNWDEDDRREKSLRHNPRQWFPLAETPYINNRGIAEYLRSCGVEPPSMYDHFRHANCAGACLKAGQAQWRQLLRVDRGRYLYNEEQEEQFRRVVNDRVSILRDFTGGTTTALPLRVFRERLEQQGGLFDETDWGGCGCGVLSAMMPEPSTGKALQVLEVER